MDTVVHDGKEYKKVAILAKEFNYTTDYIGQLCRAEKVDARLVGRAWYVNPDSLKEHKKGRYQESFKNKLVENDTKPEIKNYLERVDVSAVRTNKTVKIHKYLKDEFKEYTVRYESDDEALLPRVVKSVPPVTVPVDLAEAKELHIKKPRAVTKPTLLKPGPLPKVYLKGKLPVTDIPEKAALPVSTLNPEKVQAVNVRGIERSRGVVLKKELPKTEEIPKESLKSVNKPLKYSHPGINMTAINKPGGGSQQREKSVRSTQFQHSVELKIAAAQKTTSKKNREKSSIWMIWTLFVVLALAVVSLLLFVSNTLLVSDNETTSTLHFSPDSALQFLK